MLTTKAEYIAMSEACYDARLVRPLLAELIALEKDHSTLYCDNGVSISWAESSDSMRRAKHIDIKYNFVEQGTVDEIARSVNVNSDKPSRWFFKTTNKNEIRIISRVHWSQPMEGTN